MTKSPAIPMPADKIVGAPVERMLTAKFIASNEGAVREAFAMYAKSLDAPVGDVSACMEVFRGEVIVTGQPHVVMGLIGYVSDMGHDGLVSVQ